jgi:CMP-N,N'-diacetyllegionaminic acid synthase
MPKPTIVAFIPAKATSKRVPGKNVRKLGGHPLLAWTIAAARESGIFWTIIVSTDSADTADMARDYGAVPLKRPDAFATDTSPDIEWVRHALNTSQAGISDAFAILRPTSPFRTAETIRRAWNEFEGTGGVDSLRAVQKCTEHPYKMWQIYEEGFGEKRIRPLFNSPPGETPWHSSQYQTLPETYVQNASLEMAWTKVVSDAGTIAGHIVMPFFTYGHEGFDINLEDDFRQAEQLLERGEVAAPLSLGEGRQVASVGGWE